MLTPNKRNRRPPSRLIEETEIESSPKAGSSEYKLRGALADLFSKDTAINRLASGLPGSKGTPKKKATKGSKDKAPKKPKKKRESQARGTLKWAENVSKKYNDAIETNR